MRVLIIEDHALFRDGVSLILGQLSDAIEIDEGESVEQGLGLAGKDLVYDLILMDYHLPDSKGLDCLEQIIPLQPNTPIIMLSAEQDSELIKRALGNGAKGFITKSSSSQIMLSAIKLVLAGGIYVPAEMLTSNTLNTSTPQAHHASPSESLGIARNGNTFENRLTTNRERSKKTYQLTERQKEVLAHMLEGESNKEIAKELNMSPSTVKVHVAAILRELDVKNRTQAVNIAKTESILD